MFDSARLCATLADWCGFIVVLLVFALSLVAPAVALIDSHRISGRSLVVTTERAAPRGETIDLRAVERWPRPELVLRVPARHAEFPEAGSVGRP